MEVLVQLIQSFTSGYETFGGSKRGWTGSIRIPLAVRMPVHGWANLSGHWMGMTNLHGSRLSYVLVFLA